MNILPVDHIMAYNKYSQCVCNMQSCAYRICYPLTGLTALGHLRHIHLTLQGSTALMIAAKNGHISVIRALILHGANRAATNFEASQLLSFALLPNKDAHEHLITTYITTYTCCWYASLIAPSQHALAT